jgi:hypothetical protein
MAHVLLLSILLLLDTPGAVILDTITNLVEGSGDGVENTIGRD